MRVVMKLGLVHCRQERAHYDMGQLQLNCSITTKAASRPLNGDLIGT